ncbi:MAG: hypothetical protein V3R94_01950 [Acidobacteriota bacterium]
MKKSTVIIIGLLLLMGVASMAIMRSYELDLVHGVVLNTLIQKGPKDFSRQTVQETFRAARAAAEGENLKQAYLDDLFALSQRLEKIQELSREEMDEILDSLNP